MKVNAVYQIVFDAIGKLKENQPLNPMETTEVLKVLEAVQGDYIPSKEEYEDQIRNVRQLNLIDVEKNREQWDRVMEKCKQFENKYC